jgi:hypothetical protein
VTHASGFRKIEEGRYPVSEVHSHDRRDQVEAIDPLHGGPMGRCIVPVEVDIGAVAAVRTLRPSFAASREPDDYVHFSNQNAEPTGERYCH